MEEICDTRRLLPSIHYDMRRLRKPFRYSIIPRRAVCPVPTSPFRSPISSSLASVDKGTHGSAGRKCPHTASKPLRIHTVFSAVFSLSASMSAPAELLRIGQPWIFERFLFFWTQAHLSPAKDKRAKSTEKTSCPTCVPLLIDAFIPRYLAGAAGRAGSPRRPR